MGRPLKLYGYRQRQEDALLPELFSCTKSMRLVLTHACLYAVTL